MNDLSGWSAGGASTISNPSGGGLVVTNTSSNPVCSKNFTAASDNEYTLYLNLTSVPAGNVNVVIDGIYHGNYGVGNHTIAVSASVVETAQILLVSPTANSTFEIKFVELEETVLEHTTVSYTINYAADYFPYGKVVREYQAGDKERFLTTQHERDQETGLDYRGARYYDAETGRFLSLDPLSKEFPSWSAYNYCMGNPLSLVDKDGKAPQFAGGGDPPVAKFPTGVATASIGVNKRVKELAKTNDVPLPKPAPKPVPKPTAPTNPNQWQSDFAQWNKEYNQKIWDKATPEQKSQSNAIQNVLQPLRDASIEMAKPVAQLYTLQASFGGSGMATGMRLGNSTQTVYRAFGGDARAQGFSWTPVNPLSVKNFRNLAGLPSGGASGATNTADFMIIGQVNINNIIKSRSALPLDGNIGGLTEFIIDPNNVKLFGFKVLKQ